MTDAVAAAFAALRAHAQSLVQRRTLDLFAQNPNRFADFSVARAY